jgi:hypothetical protein
MAHEAFGIISLAIGKHLDMRVAPDEGRIIMAQKAQRHEVSAARTSEESGIAPLRRPVQLAVVPEVMTGGAGEPAVHHRDSVGCHARAEGARFNGERVHLGVDAFEGVAAGADRLPGL